MKFIRMQLVLLFSLLFAAVGWAEGSVRVEYAKPVNPTEIAVKKALESSGAVSLVSAFINDYFDLPRPLLFEFGGEDGPLYDGEKNKIFIPYAFIVEVKERFIKAGYSETGISVQEATDDALMHAMFHEFAHAAIANYALPVLGKEEDAADALATILLIEFFEVGKEIALSAADLFDIESDDREVLEDEDFWDEHSLDEQRYFSTLCHVYGSDPLANRSIIEQELLSDERAELCIDEYASISGSWLDILAPHLKNNQPNRLRQ